ncbi:uncharacterized protein LOC120191617 [Hibiscus syriacus]|uniref:uncharacterized protein LOC120191617 n=1 Tax=Hibiscus syriacus TaxID=106335 RepID=UPI0019218DF7|nr:uncharacterized protein LOC120191617 [Hibiscus syriacus]
MVNGMIKELATSLLIIRRDQKNLLYLFLMKKTMRLCFYTASALMTFTESKRIQSYHGETRNILQNWHLVSREYGMLLLMGPYLQIAKKYAFKPDSEANGREQADLEKSLSLRDGRTYKEVVSVANSRSLDQQRMVNREARRKQME